MPDIDIDFQDDKRENVLSYVRNKYGEDNVVQVRITSYNVCYTKLLRLPPDRDVDGHGLDLRLRGRPPAHRRVHPRGERQPLHHPPGDQPHPPSYNFV